MHETQISEPEKQTGEMESGEANNSTPDKVIVKPDNLKSTVWRFFGFWSVGGKVVDKSKAVCKLCDAELAYHSTTTNLRMHLINVHPTEWKKVGEDETEGLLPKQRRLTAFYCPTTSLPAAKQEAITKKLTEFICKDMRPISIVDGVGFQEFIHEINPRYQVPSRGTINNRIVKLYDATANTVKITIKDKAVALTTDGWTSLANDAFVTVTAHIITENWEMNDFVLKTGELRESHTAENVSKSIMDGLQEFGVQLESVVAVTTDNAANYVNAVEKHMKTMNVPCFAHTINLAVRKGLGVRSIENSVARLKRTAAYFSHSTTASYLLEEKQKQLQMLNRDKLINDCATRWNSTYDMICRALEQQTPVAAVIFDKKLSNLELSTSEWTQLEKVKDILRPFKVATVALSTDKYPTASAVLPMKHALLSHLRQETDGDTASVKEMKAKITADLNKRYPEDGDVFMFLNTASYLDPRFHCLGHLDHGRQQEVHAKVLAEITAISAAEKSGVGSELPAPLEAPQKSSLSAMGDLFSQVYQPQTRAAEYDLHGELVKYEREPQLPPDADPLLWWKTTGSARYPYITQVAKKYLTVPGTSVRSERVFSSAGNIVNKKRSALAAEQVDRLVFLANNL